MNKRHAGFLPWLAAGILLFTGCSPKSPVGTPANPSTSEGSVAGSLSVYADETYHTALTRVFRSLNNRNPKLDIQWASSPEASDILITDRIPASEASRYRTLDREAQEFSHVLIEELVFKDTRGIIGLPLFLRADCYWYDQLLYRKNETTPPFSLEEFQKNPIRKEYPALCDAADMDSLFWSTVAPLYLSEGGTADELGSARFRPQAMLPALSRLHDLCESGMLTIQDQAATRFTSNSTMFWITNFTSMADIRYDMPNLSDVSFSPTLVYHKQDSPFIALRADIVAVRSGVDSAHVKAFFKTLYDSKTLINLCNDAKVPLACRLSFGSNSVPELVNNSYTILASPSLQAGYVSCHWDADVRARILQLVADVATGTMTIHQANDALCAIS